MNNDYFLEFNRLLNQKDKQYCMSQDEITGYDILDASNRAIENVDKLKREIDSMPKIHVVNPNDRYRIRPEN